MSVSRLPLALRGPRLPYMLGNPGGTLLREGYVDAADSQQNLAAPLRNEVPQYNKLPLSMRGYCRPLLFQDGRRKYYIPTTTPSKE